MDTSHYSSEMSTPTDEATLGSEEQTLGSRFPTDVLDKNRRCKIACERCRAAHTTCGEERPCRRCTRKGFTDCQDATVEKKPPRRRLSSEPKRKTQFLEFIPGAPKKRFKSQETKDGAEAHQLFHFTIDPLPESTDEDPVMSPQVPAPTKGSPSLRVKVDMRGRSVSSPAESPRTLNIREAAFLGYGFGPNGFQTPSPHPMVAPMYYEPHRQHSHNLSVPQYFNDVQSFDSSASVQTEVWQNGGLYEVVDNRRGSSTSLDDDPSSESHDYDSYMYVQQPPIQSSSFSDMPDHYQYYMYSQPTEEVMVSSIDRPMDYGYPMDQMYSTM